MSHFPVTVCLDGKVVDEFGVHDAVAAALARFDENRDDIEAYRVFEDGAPEDHWWVRSVRRGARHHDAGTIDANDLHTDWNGIRRHTDEQLRERYADDATRVADLGPPPTSWALLAGAYNAKYHPGDALVTADQIRNGEINPDRLHFDEETGRAYTWSDCNPDAKWDWWVIGGRWQRHLIGLPGVPAAELVTGTPGSLLVVGDVESETDAGGARCDGGPVALLDFAAVREQAERQAGERFDRYLELVERYGPAKPWSHFRDLTTAWASSIDVARAAYHNQPLVAAHDRLKRMTPDAALVGWDACLVEEFLPPRDAYVEHARRAAVPGYALVTTDGAWLAPGEMGWFGMSSDEAGDRVAYAVRADAYLDALPADVWIVQVDCHI